MFPLNWVDGGRTNEILINLIKDNLYPIDNFFNEILPILAVVKCCLIIVCQIYNF